MSNYPDGVGTFSPDAPWNTYREPTPEEEAWEVISDYEPLGLCSSLEYALRDLMQNHPKVYKAYFQFDEGIDAIGLLKKIEDGFQWLQIDSSVER